MAIMEFLLPLLFLFGLLWSISKLRFFKNSPFSIRSLQFAFTVRVVMGFILFLIYSKYYTVRQDADTFKYFDDSKYMYDAFWSHPLDYFQMLLGIDCNTEYFNTNYFDHMSNWVRSYDNGLFNDNRLVIRINAFMRIFSFGNYHVHSLLLSYFAFLGSFSLAQVFYKVSKVKLASYFAVFLVPSVIFWSSGILKEAVLLFALGFFTYNVYELSGRHKRLRSYAVLFLMSCILIVMKLYVFVAFIPPVIAWLVISKWRRGLWGYFGVYLIFFALATLIGEFDPRYDFVNLIVDKQKQFIGLAEFYQVNSGFAMQPLSYDIWAIVKAGPEGLINVLTKPWPSEVNSILFIPPFVENTLILVLIFLSIVYRKSLSQKEWDFAIFCISFCFILFLVIGLTTPITGALVRYKIPGIPFLLMAICIFISQNKLPKFLSQSKLAKFIRELI